MRCRSEWLFLLFVFHVGCTSSVQLEKPEEFEQEQVTTDPTATPTPMPTSTPIESPTPTPTPETTPTPTAEPPKITPTAYDLYATCGPNDTGEAYILPKATRTRPYEIRSTDPRYPFPFTVTTTDAWIHILNPIGDTESPRVILKAKCSLLANGEMRDGMVQITAGAPGTGMDWGLVHVTKLSTFVGTASPVFRNATMLSGVCNADQLTADFALGDVKMDTNDPSLPFPYLILPDDSSNGWLYGIFFQGFDMPADMSVGIECYKLPNGFSSTSTMTAVATDLPGVGSTSLQVNVTKMAAPSGAPVLRVNGAVDAWLDVNAVCPKDSTATMDLSPSLAVTSSNAAQNFHFTTQLSSGGNASPFSFTDGTAAPTSVSLVSQTPSTIVFKGDCSKLNPGDVIHGLFRMISDHSPGYGVEHIRARFSKAN